MLVVTIALPRLSASSTLTLIPPPIRSGQTTTAARSRYGSTSGTGPVTVTLPPASARTSAGGPEPTSTRCAPGMRFVSRGRISLQNQAAAQAFGS